MRLSSEVRFALRPLKAADIRATASRKIARAAMETLEDRRLLSSTSGAIDTAYGAHGTATLPLGNFVTVADAAVDANGKLLAAGSVGTDNNGDDFALARFTSNGSPDASFGTGGVANTDFAADDDEIHRILVEPSGKILAAGVSGGDFALAQYNANGSLDTTFGNGGIVTTDFGGDDEIYGIALAADGSIIAAGTSDDSLALARYNANGSLDSTFGSGGKVTTAPPASAGADATVDDCAGVKLFGNGQILVVGDESDDNGAGAALFAYYDPNGTLNALDLGASFETSPTLSDFVRLGNGQVLAIGSNDTSNFALSRYNADASLDTSFGTDGSTADLLDSGTNLVVQPDGKILVAGTPSGSSSANAVARFNADGSVDAGFGSDGLVFSPQGDGDGIVALQADGKVIAVSSGSAQDAASDPSADPTAAVVASRYLPDVGVTPPTVSFQASQLTARGQNAIPFEVTYSSGSGIDLNSLGDGNIAVIRSDGSSLPVAFDHATQNGDGSITAVYNLQKDDSSHNFNSADDDVYTVELQPDEVLDNGGVAAAAGELGTITINITPPPGGIVPPAASLQDSILSAPATTDVTISVTYNGPVAIDDNTLEDFNLVATAPDGSTLDVTFLDATDNADGSVTAQYSIQKDQHAQFTSADNGAYTIAMEGDEVTDIEGTAVTAGTLGKVTVNVPAAPAGAVAPTATLDAPPLTDSYSEQFSVTYSGPAAIAQNTLDDFDLVVTGPNGFTQSASFAGATVNADGSVTAQYTVGVYASGFVGGHPILNIPVSTSSGAVSANARSTANAATVPTNAITLNPIAVIGGTGSTGATATVNPANGTYTVSIQANQVSDVRGVTITAATLGTFEVSLPANLAPPVYLASGSGGPVLNASGGDRGALLRSLARRRHLHHLHATHAAHMAHVRRHQVRQLRRQRKA